jgi:plastocyanin
MPGSTSAVIGGLAAGIVFVLTFSIYGITLQTSSASKETSIVTIPKGASLVGSQHNNFEPKVITVQIGQNNTVRWINKDAVLAGVKADDKSDPKFFESSYNYTFLAPNGIFEFTFTKPGRFDYHSEPHPWMHGTVIVLPRHG